MNDNLYDYTKSMVLKEFYSYNLVIFIFIFLLSSLILLWTYFNPMIISMILIGIILFLLFLYPWGAFI